MMRPVPIVMPELKQRKQEQEKAAASRKGDSVSRRCHRRILLGQGPCEVAKSFASTETRRHDVGQTASAQGRHRRSGLLRFHCCRDMWSKPFLRCLGEKFWAERHVGVRAVLPFGTVPTR